MARLLPHERFYTKVTLQPGGCLRWTGAYNTPKSRRRPWLQTRRPVFWFHGRLEYALRVALHFKDGVPLSQRRLASVEACHQLPCKDPTCVNADHAYWGTADQNRRDRYSS